MEAALSMLGGVGIFLVGMHLLTEGLSAAAGRSLRQGLSRATKGRLSAILTGAGVTALVQSSSATTLATIGFVSVGLLTFQQAVGVIFGANVGTTVTSWMVSLIGLNVKIDAFALPLVGTGALLRSFAKGRTAHLGAALAGFGLIFVGIDVLQGAMAGLGGLFSPERFAGQGWWGDLALVGLGIVMTVVMQSSSAAVAATLTALASGTIDLEQASALVIGQNVGTTVTAWVGAVGGSLAAKRTAAAHSMFNVLTGLVAFFLIPAFLWSMTLLTAQVGEVTVATQLALFHTAFNLLGVLVLTPFMGPFTRLIERVLPDAARAFTGRLDREVQVEGELGLGAVEATARELLGHLVDVTYDGLNGLADEEAWAARLREVGPALHETRVYLGGVRVRADDDEQRLRQIALSHALDHLQRLDQALVSTGALAQARDAASLSEAREVLNGALGVVSQTMHSDGELKVCAGRVAELSRQLARQRVSSRRELLREMADGVQPPGEAEALTEQLGALRWLDQLGYHIWRVVHHLSGEVEWADV
jgi:phosphate:Na+ symporter